jgi:SET domain-containing protein
VIICDVRIDLKTPNVSWYVFGRENFTNRNYVALALGYGSMYNHSYTPNARYTPIVPDLMEFHSLRLIQAGEEIMINYNGDPDDHREVEFDVH